MKATTDRQGALQNPEAFIPDLSFSQTASGLFVASLEPFHGRARKRPRNGPAVCEEFENVRNGLGEARKGLETVRQRLENA